MQKASESINIPPYNKFNEPLFSLYNIGIIHPANRPKEQVILKRQTLELTGVEEFSKKGLKF